MGILISYQCDLCSNVYENEDDLNSVELKINEYSCNPEKIDKMVCQSCMVIRLSPAIDRIFAMFS